MSTSKERIQLRAELLREIFLKPDLAQLRKRNLAQAGFSLPGEAGENHGDVITSVLVSGASDDHSIAMNAPFASRRFQGDGHFGPGREGSGTTKFDAVSVNDNGVWGK